MDNVFIERLWRSLKYECVYLHAFETGSELRAGLSHWIDYDYAQRPLSILAGRTPDATPPQPTTKSGPSTNPLRGIGAVIELEARAQTISR
jgi:putative transposase